MNRRKKREAAAELECAMCVGNRQLLEQLQQDVAAIREQYATVPVRIAATDVHPGDVLVLTAPHHLSDDEVSAIGDELRQHFPGGEALVIDGGMHINVIRPEGAA